jgi:hypothetical protein
MLPAAGGAVGSAPWSPTCSRAKKSSDSSGLSLARATTFRRSVIEVSAFASREKGRLIEKRSFPCKAGLLLLLVQDAALGDYQAGTPQLFSR